MLKAFSKVKKNSLSVELFGDISLNGLLCDPQHYQHLKESLVELSGFLDPSAVRIGNWEAPLWSGTGFNNNKEPRICTTEDAAKAVFPLNLNVAVLANNHAFDCLKEGFVKTTYFFNKHGVKWLGAGLDLETSSQAVIIERAGWKIGILAYVDCRTNPSIPSDARFFLNYLEEERLLLEVKKLSQRVDVVIVSLHWGTEFIRLPSNEQRRLARRSVVAGAKIVVGHHPHRLQGYELWENGIIFYSLGNFIFAGLCGRETKEWPLESRQTGVAICRISLRGEIEASLFPLVQVGYGLRVDQSPNREKMINKLCCPLRLPYKDYQRYWNREIMFQSLVGYPMRYIKNQDSILGAAKRLKISHIKALASVFKQIRT